MQADRETCRQAERHAERQKDRHTVDIHCSGSEKGMDADWLKQKGLNVTNRAGGGVTLVSRWEGFPAMFFRIREVSLSR